mgnify:CR=1 FL=1
MARIVFVVAMLAVTIYAAADWHRTPEDEMPGKIAKPIWLMIILFTATIAAIGPIAWLVLRWVSRAEKKQSRAPEAPKRPSAPDDDPEFLFRLERDIQRKRREDERRAADPRVAALDARCPAAHRALEALVVRQGRHDLGETVAVRGNARRLGQEETGGGQVAGDHRVQVHQERPQHETNRTGNQRLGAENRQA